MGPSHEEPRRSHTGSLPARHLDRRFPGSAWRASGSRRAEPVASAIGRLKEGWQDDYVRWQRRDLSTRHYVYIWADGVYLQARMEDNAACMLILIGATPEGRKELVGFQVGVREIGRAHV